MIFCAKPYRVTILLLVFITALLSTGPSLAQKKELERRLGQIVEANVIAVHAFQVLLAKQSGKGDKSCFSPGKLSDAELNALSDHQAGLLKSDLQEVSACEGK